MKNRILSLAIALSLFLAGSGISHGNPAECIKYEYSNLEIGKTYTITSNYRNNGMFGINARLHNGYCDWLFDVIDFPYEQLLENASSSYWKPLNMSFIKKPPEGYENITFKVNITEILQEFSPSGRKPAKKDIVGSLLKKLFNTKVYGEKYRARFVEFDQQYIADLKAKLQGSSERDRKAAEIEKIKELEYQQLGKALATAAAQLLPQSYRRCSARKISSTKLMNNFMLPVDVLN
ncbi:MAG TPA: hypothetical protein PLT06_11095 [Syntrophorhabdaceae bacterium]|nr:hypothetical protein [Syntrophorhabdaceae bacterium]HQJ95365.1 hypothetical protein [Syntrophorhabdaceae bacterium]